MSHKQVLQLVITVILIMSFLVGCGGSAPTAVSEAPTATLASEQTATTPTPEPPAATPTPEPPTATPLPPTATPIPPTPTPELPTSTPMPTATTGQVKGILIDQASQQPIGEVSVFLAQVKEGGGFSVSAESPAIETNKEGEFTFEEVSPGKYMLIGGTKSPERDDKGKIVPAFNAFIPPMKDDKGEVMIIEVVAGEVIDLGQVLTASSNFP